MDRQLQNVPSHIPQFNVVSKSKDCCNSVKLVSCVACAMDITVAQACSELPSLIGCGKNKKDSVIVKPNLRKSSLDEPLLFDSDEEFEELIFSLVSKEELIKGTFSTEVDGRIHDYARDYGLRHKEGPRNAMKFAFSNYEKYAMGHDELRPTYFIYLYSLFRSGKFNDRWGGNGVTLIDALDTLWLMDMKDEFYRGRDWISKNLKFNHNKFVSFFETTIRDLGGLLSAYYLSEEKIFLEKAEELGRYLFQTVENDPMPMGQINLVTGKGKSAGWLKGDVILSEIGTCQLEFIALGNLIGEDKMISLSKGIFDKIEHDYPKKDGLIPTRLSPTHPGSKTSKTATLSFGALGDSFYEYLLKVWIQGGYEDERFRKWYEESIEGLSKHLLHTTRPNGLTMIVQAKFNKLSKILDMEHLSCFTPGLLALGVLHSPEDYEFKERDLILAKKIAFTCVEAYFKTPTGLGPEVSRANPQTDFESKSGAKHYLLRPETVESLYVLYQVTKHPIYRVWGKKIMENIEKHTRTTYGYGSYPDVTKLTKPKDEMESFFFAETLKYLYLLQSDDSVIDLKTWVFNTEAHPLKVLS